MTLFFGACVIAMACVAVLRKLDVRLVLLLAAAALAMVAGLANCLTLLSHGGSTGTALRALTKPLFLILRTLLVTISDEKFVVPICLAMAFAYVLRETQCDQNLVRLLVKPFGHIRSLFLPGVMITGFLVNVPMISPSATAAAVGAVLVPLGRALRISPQLIGSALLVGCSIGGALLNPGAPEIRSVVEGVRHIHPSVQPAESVGQVRRFLSWHFLTAATVFVLLNRPSRVVLDVDPESRFRVNLFKAAIPFIPLLLLASVSPPIQIWRVPRDWLLMDPSSSTEARFFEGRLIGAAMLVGVLLAAATSPKAIDGVAKSFFEGAGFAFSSIVGMIVGANCFGEGIKAIGLAEALGSTINHWPILLLPLAAICPMLFAALSGSGVGTTQSLFQLLVDPSLQHGVPPLEVGAVVSMGAAAGRTISPVSPPTLMSAKLTEVDPLELSQRVLIPLLVGMVVTVIIAMLS